MPRLRAVFFQAEDGIRDYKVTGVQTWALPISRRRSGSWPDGSPYDRRGDVASFLTWLAVAAGAVGAVIVLIFLLSPLWNDERGPIVFKKHEDTYRNQGRDRARDR